MKKHTKKSKTMYIAITVIGLLLLGAIALQIFLHTAPFGRLPGGKRLESIVRSPNYREGQFRNRSLTPQLTSDKSFFENLIGFLFRKIDNLRPETEIPVVKTDLETLPPEQEVLVWFGHSSYLLRTAGVTFLADPVFHRASPVGFVNKAFPGTEAYKPADMPDIDYLLITHDHWDHFDYRTVKELEPRIGKVICPLGVGEHFERWGFTADRLIELDWDEEARLKNDITVYGLPARHFSGRGLKGNQSLWSSYLIQTPQRNIYIAGDGGYDTHFAAIGERFAPIDLAILENGQYDADWRYIHLMPDDIEKTIRDLGANRVMTVHHAKYALAKHPWKQPLENAVRLAEKDSVNLWTPRIGEPVYLADSTSAFSRWWETVE